MRHEQVAAHAADGYARATGKASVVLTHLGPGLTNAATGVANAALDCIPMVVIAGDVPSHYFGKHPHQEVNLHADGAQYEIYRPFVKRAWRVDDPTLVRRDHRQGVPARGKRAAGPGAGRRADGRVLGGSRLALLRRDSSSNTRALRKPSLDVKTAREIVRALGRSAAAADLRRRRHRAGASVGRAARVRRSHGNSSGAQPDGQRRAARRSSAGARHERLLGHEARQRHVPRRRLGAGPRHALQGSGLQLLVSRTTRSTFRRRGSSTSTSSRARSAATSPPRSAPSPT